MQRGIILLFGLFAYSLFFLTFLYLIAFVGNLPLTAITQWLPWLPALVPLTIDAGRAVDPVALAATINLILIALFGLQHSVMARTGFKAWLKQRLPASAERSFYVLLASLMLILLFWQWRPMPTVVWSIDSPVVQSLAWLMFALGFAIVLVSTFLIDHFDLFGLRQVWRQFSGQAAPEPHFVTPLFYRFVRHPLYLGFILAFWSTPRMSLGHLLFAVAMTAYILVAIRFEERDLVRQLGERYAGYRREVPMLVPNLLSPTRARDTRRAGG